MERYYKIDKEQILNDIKSSYENKIKYDSEIGNIKTELIKLQSNLTKLQRTGILIQDKLKIICNTDIEIQFTTKKNNLVKKAIELNSVLFNLGNILKKRRQVCNANQFLSFLSRIATLYTNQKTNYNRFLITKRYTSQLMSTFHKNVKEVSQGLDKISSVKYNDLHVLKNTITSENFDFLEFQSINTNEFKNNIGALNKVKQYIGKCKIKKPSLNRKKYTSSIYIINKMIKKIDKISSTYKNKRLLIYILEFNSKRNIKLKKEKIIEHDRIQFIEKSKEELGKLNLFINKYRLIKFRMEIKALLNFNECLANVKKLDGDVLRIKKRYN